MKISYSDDCLKGPIKLMKVKMAIAALEELNVSISINGKIFSINQADINIGENKSTATLVDTESREIKGAVVKRELNDKTDVIIAIQVPM